MERLVGLLGGRAPAAHSFRLGLAWLAASRGYTLHVTHGTQYGITFSVQDNTLKSRFNISGGCSNRPHSKV